MPVSRVRSRCRGRHSAETRLLVAERSTQATERRSGTHYSLTIGRPGPPQTRVVEGFYLEHGGGATFAEIVNTTFSGNIAGENSGGGIYNASFMTLTNNTIAANEGGGLFNEVTGTNQTRMFNSIVIENMNGTDPGDILGRALIIGANNDNDSSNDGGANNIIGDPMTAGTLTNGFDGNIVGDGLGGVLPIQDVILEDLTDNGGLTLTHALVQNSLAKDTGDNVRAAFGGANLIPHIVLDGDTPLAFDQRGQSPFRRTWDGNSRYRRPTKSSHCW